MRCGARFRGVSQGMRLPLAFMLMKGTLLYRLSRRCRP